MKEYHKIDSIYKRDERGKFLIGQYSRPEFEYLKDLPWLWTEKINGTNIRVMLSSDPLDNRILSISFGGKTDNAQIPAKLVEYLRKTFPSPTKMADVLGIDAYPSEPVDICLYGEGFGAGIEKGGGNYSPDQKFILFDVKIGKWWLLRKDVEDIAKDLGIPVVPLMMAGGVFTLEEVITMVYDTMNAPDSIKQYIGIPTSQVSMNAKVEGYVGTPLVPLFARNGDRIITKIKYKDFR